MSKYIFSLLLITSGFLAQACSPQPRPIVFGKDACSHCRMIISDPKFGYELVTTKGKVYVFDDLNCYWNFRHEQKMGEKQIAHSVVYLYDQSQKFVAVTEAHFVKANAVRSPMGSGFAAFSSAAAADGLQGQAQHFSWLQIAEQFKP